MSPPEVEQGDILLSCFMSHIVNKHAFHGLFGAAFFCFSWWFCFFRWPPSFVWKCCVVFRNTEGWDVPSGEDMFVRQAHSGLSSS